MITTMFSSRSVLAALYARQDGDIDWLLKRDDPTEDHGYAAFIADEKFELVLGAVAIEKVLTFDEWPYDRPVLVLSRQLTDTPVPEALKGKVQFSCRTPGEALADLMEKNVHRVYIDGGRY